MQLPPAAPVATLIVTCRLFARYAELFNRESLTLALPAGATVADAVEALRSQLPRGDQLPPRPLVAVNLEHALMGRALQPGDEMALLPPLAGG
jgi:molybdopterin converting factor small subunit